MPFSIEGTSVVAGTGIALDLDFSDAIDLLDFAIAARTEFWNGDWGIIADLYYVDLGMDGQADLPGPGGGTADVDINITQKWAALMGSYRFAHGTYGPSNRSFAWDAAAGVRWNSIKQKVDADVDVGNGSGVQTSLGGTETWWEPTVMLRGAYDVAEKWTIGGRVELGGFGVNDDKLQYTAVLGADWHKWENVSLKFGYVFYGIDYETDRSDGAFEYDVDQHGPFIGATIRF